MPTSTDQRLAILSLDSYHRGYGKNLEITVPATGEAIFLTNSDRILVNRTQAEEESFYAAAYAVDDTIIISLRGRDDIPLDMQAGWTTGPESLGSQARFAAEH